MSGPTIIPTLIRENAPGVGAYIPAELHLDYPMDQLAATELEWAGHRAILSERAEHRHWNWRAKAESSLRFVALLRLGRCEGLLAAKRRLWPGIRSGPPRLYVSYIEAAPWNHRLYPDPPTYSSVGAALMAGAVQASLRTDAAGAVTLHSLDQACPSYRRWGMMDCGRDPMFDDLTLFEFSTSDAMKFLEEYEHERSSRN